MDGNTFMFTIMASILIRDKHMRVTIVYMPSADKGRHGDLGIAS